MKTCLKRKYKLQNSSKLTKQQIQDNCMKNVKNSEGKWMPHES